MNELKTKPKFTHDCLSCIFLGSATIDGKDMDFYVHESPSGDRAYASLLGRYGNEAHEYMSTHPAHASPLSPHSALALALYVQHLGADGADAFPRGVFFKDGGVVLSLNKD